MVLLAAIAQAQVALGLALIVAFSLGLATTLTVLGLAVVWAGRFAGRVPLGPRTRAVAETLPAASAALIILAGTAADRPSSSRWPDLERLSTAQAGLCDACGSRDAAPRRSCRRRRAPPARLPRPHGRRDEPHRHVRDAQRARPSYGRRRARVLPLGHVAQRAHQHHARGDLPGERRGPARRDHHGLSPSTTYYFRVCATDNAGTDCAELHDFKTLASNGDAVVAAAGDIGDDTPSPTARTRPARSSRRSGSPQGPHPGRQRLRGRHAGRVRRELPRLGGATRTASTAAAANGFGDRLRPALGNHEYQTANAEGTFDFFNGQYASGSSTVNLQYGLAGLRGQGYYPHDVGNWRLIALNTSDGGPIDSGPARLAAEGVAGTRGRACWPTSTTRAGRHATAGMDDDPDMASIWTRLWSASNTSKRADLILNGHVHHYDRFARQNLTGGADANGMRQVTVGTGGVEPHNFQTIHPRSEVRPPGARRPQADAARRQRRGSVHRHGRHGARHLHRAFCH